MKIKSDFVTNSSSTSFVVYIPDGTSFERLIISDSLKSDIAELADEIEDDDEAFKEGLKELKETYDDFLSSGDYYEGDSYSVFRILEELFSDNNLIIMSSEGAPDCGNITLFRRLHLDKIEDINRRMS